MKALVTYKNYPVNVTSAGSFSANFNLNTKDWHLLDGRVNIESSSQSFLAIKFPGAGSTSKRPYSVRYGLSCKSDIPGVPVAVIEDYSSTPITGDLSLSSDKWVNFPVNTEKMADFSYSPSDVYGYINVDTDIYPYIAQGSQYWNDQYIVLQVMPSWKTPAISNIAVNQLDPRVDMQVTWDSDIQDLCDLQVWQSGTLLKTIATGTAKSGIIPKNTLPAVGQFTITVVAANNPIDDLGKTGSASANFTAAVPAVTASNFQIDQTERRSPIVGTWDSTNQSDFKLEVLRGEVVEYMTTGTTQKTFSIPPGTLDEGDVVFKLTVNNTFGAATSTVILNQSKTITFSRPVITSLEPDGINQNVDNQINVSWACSNQETYILKAYQDNVLIKTYSGNTQKNIVIPDGTFKAGNIKLELICSNTVNGVVAISSRTATFIGYGRPEAPVLDQQYIYNNARPNFMWEAAEQIAYIFEIWKDNAKIEGTTEILGPAKSYTPETALSNNATFIVKVKIKNQFNLWSDFATKEITVSYTELPKPIFDLTRDGSGILITMLTPDTPGLGTLEVWRKDTYSNWVRLAYDMKRTDQWTDNTVASGKLYHYKVIANALNGGMSESDIKTEKANVNDFVFVNIEDTTNKAVLRWNPKISITNMRKITSKIYAGCIKPKVERGKVKYKIARMEFTVKKPELEYLQYLADTSQVILFRDRRGEKIYGQISSDISETYEMMDRVNISFEFTELNFIEKDIHKGSGGIVLTFFNGAWKFDGSIDFSGYGVL